MEYTKNYHLPQWVKEDRIMMDDFNAAMSSIENGIMSTAHALDVKIGTAQATANTARSEAAEAAKLPYVVGTYTGDGSTSRNISLGFRPSFIIVSGQDEKTSDSGTPRFFIATVGSAFSEMFVITDDGFWAQHIANRYPDLNMRDRIYDYIAFR